jgi:2-dehydropantoate 2-reductase
VKVAIVGCGALGSYYGAALARSGHETHFLLRSDFDRVQRFGVTVLSPQGDFTVHPKCHLLPESIGPCDLILIGLKTTANGEFPRLLPALVDSRSMVLTLQNGLGNEEQLARIIRPDQILGGLCFVCLNRIAPGEIRHLAHGRIVLGEYSGAPLPRTHALATQFVSSGIPCEVVPSLACAHWLKLIWNIPFNGLGVASSLGWDAYQASRFSREPLQDCLTTDQLLADPRWRVEVRQLMHEVLIAAQLMGHPVADNEPEEQIARTREMGAYRASTLVDFEAGRPLEIESLFLEPWRQATGLGLAMPRLGHLCSHLQQLSQATRFQP